MASLSQLRTIAHAQTRAPYFGDVSRSCGVYFDTPRMKPWSKHARRMEPMNGSANAFCQGSGSDDQFANSHVGQARVRTGCLHPAQILASQTQKRRSVRRSLG